MHISVVSRGDIAHSPETLALLYSLRSVGHAVTAVHRGTPVLPVPGVAVHAVQPVAAGGMLRRILLRLTRRASVDSALRASLATTGAEVVYPARRADLDLIGNIAKVVLDPRWGEAHPQDIAAHAACDPRWSTSPAGPALSTHLAVPSDAPTQPTPERHAGVTIALAARFTEANPARYLRAAMARAGIDVVPLDGHLDWSAVPAGCRGVVIVESPLPALRQTGTKPDLPIVFWVHHGENHLTANVRLARRYRADAVLLAHSWHLAHRFPVPVHRFPFGVAPELTDASRPFADRRFDVAMVAAGLTGSSPAYAARLHMTGALAAALPGRTAFRTGISPEDMAELYADARIVVNDGGDRHHPITMRVFEALGSGAALLTEDVPGLAVLLQPHDDYIPMGDDPAAQVEELLASGTAERTAAAGAERAKGHHTYDHRVDELLEILERTDPGRAPAHTEPSDPLSRAVDADVDVHTVAALGCHVDLPDRAVYADAAAAARLETATVDAAVIGSAGAVPVAPALGNARRYVYAAAEAAPQVADGLAGIHGAVDAEELPGAVRFDLGAPGYRVR